MDYIINIFQYYSKFVSKPVLSKLFIQGDETKNSGYDELMSDMLTQPDIFVIPDIETFICSANPKFVANSIPNSKGITLFVEYGKFSFNPLTTDGVTEGLSITICHDYSISNNDMVNEALLMNDCNNILNGILLRMKEDQELLENCGLRLITFPADIFPIDPKQFFDRSGWVAQFENNNSVI